jgi:spermidine/putrescine transport system substrate-binding protein
MAYRKDKLDNPPHSWRVLGESGDLPTSILNDMRDAMAIALFATGSTDPNSIDEKALDAARDLLIEWMTTRDVGLNSSSYGPSLIAGELAIAHAYCGDIRQLEDPDARIGVVLPEAGYATTCDCLCISSATRQSGLAHKFLDFMCDYRNAKDNMRWTYYISPIREDARIPFNEDEKRLFSELAKDSAGGIMLQPISAEAEEGYRRRWQIVLRSREMRKGRTK